MPPSRIRALGKDVNSGACVFVWVCVCVGFSACVRVHGKRRKNDQLQKTQNTPVKTWSVLTLKDCHCKEIQLDQMKFAGTTINLTSI